MLAVRVGEVLPVELVAELGVQVVCGRAGRQPDFRWDGVGGQGAVGQDDATSGCLGASGRACRPGGSGDDGQASGDCWDVRLVGLLLEHAADGLSGRVDERDGAGRRGEPECEDGDECCESAHDASNI